MLKIQLCKYIVVKLRLELDRTRTCLKPNFYITQITLILINPKNQNSIGQNRNPIETRILRSSLYKMIIRFTWYTFIIINFYESTLLAFFLTTKKDLGNSYLSFEVIFSLQYKFPYLPNEELCTKHKYFIYTIVWWPS